MTLCTFKHVNIQIAWKIYLSFGKKEKKNKHTFKSTIIRCLSINKNGHIMGIFGMLSFSYGKPHFNRNLFHHRLTIQNYFTNIKLKLSKQLSTQKGFHFSVQLTKIIIFKKKTNTIATS